MRDSSSRPRSSTPSRWCARRARAAAVGDQRRGPALADRTARATARRSRRTRRAPTRTKPTIAPGLRRSRRNASDQSPPVALERELSATRARRSTRLLPAEPDPRVDEAVRDVDEQVDERRRRSRRRGCRPGSPGSCGRRSPAAASEPIPGYANTVSVRIAPESRRPDLEADDRRDRQQRVAHARAAMSTMRGAQSLRARRADVVLVLDVEDGRARDPGDDRERDRPERDRGQDQVLGRRPRTRPGSRSRSASRR